MSFSVSFIGKPDAIKRKLAETSACLTHQSKTEFDALKPALDTILDQQVGNGVVSLNANGHATFDAGGVKTYGNCSVDVKTLGQIAE
jgi:fructose-1-phosphate kinase PfkB-like protein